MALTLVIGNKNYSSWSLRAWLGVFQTGESFEEVVIPLDQPDTAQSIARWSPAGRVPILRDGELTVWDSLSILEYLAERFPGARLLPADRAARARCRSVAAEMHAGFAALREAMPMNIRLHAPGRAVGAEVAANIGRICAIWRDCLAASGGPFLFGGLTVADCMYAPVVTRFRTYAVPLDGAEARYAQTVWEWPGMKRWVVEAQAEPWKNPKYDVP
ncbi:MAG TPA: glutathione S-transferase family protein, partial [Haliangiales bacterium]|nr:glutathione S-transferase family protein [Haliangiales bacterium]